MSFTDKLAQLVLSGVTQGSIYALIALGFVTVYSVTRIINFSQGEFAVLGSLVTLTLSQSLVLFRGQVTVDVQLPVAVAGAVGVLVAVLASLLLYRFGLQPARRASVLTQIVITIGAAIALRGLMQLAWGTDPYRLRPFTAGPPLRVLGAVVSTQSVWVLGLTALAVALLYAFFRYTVTGMALRASAANPGAARLMGINTQHMGLLAFALSAGVVALAGIVITPITFMIYDRGLMLGLKGFVASIVGGLSKPAGAVVGGLLLGVVESLAAGLLSSGYRDAFTFITLFVVLLVRLGLKRADQEGL